MEAIKRIRDETVLYDAVFMDHMMPEMDGIEATRIIRNEIGTEYAKTVPIIALTANVMSGNEEMFSNSGFTAFLSKPIDIMRLDVLLNQYVRDKEKEAKLAKERKTDAKITSEHLTADDVSLADEYHFLDGITIDGLDIPAGIAYYGTEKVYNEILKSYSTHTPELLRQLGMFTQASALVTLEDYGIAVHGLKSSSYGICANNVGKQAEELEALAKANNADEVHKRNGVFLRDAQKLVDDISAMLQQTTPTADSKEICKKIDSALLDKILDAAEHFKTKDLEGTVAELEKFDYKNKADAELVSWLRNQIDRLEYEAICRRLKKE
jgi:CheY-like chemotaxis protein